MIFSNYRITLLIKRIAELVKHLAGEAWDKLLNCIPDMMNTGASVHLNNMSLLHSNSAKLKGTLNNIITRMTTSISSEAQRIQTSILIRGRENHVSP